MPKFMSMIINNGVADRDTGYIIRHGHHHGADRHCDAAGGIGGAYFSAKASICFTSDLRDALFAKVQNFSFKNIDQYSTGSLVTRLTNDVQQVQNVTMMGLRLLFRAPGMLIGAADHGISDECQAGIGHFDRHSIFVHRHCDHYGKGISTFYSDAEED